MYWWKSADLWKVVLQRIELVLEASKVRYSLNERTSSGVVPLSTLFCLRFTKPFPSFTRRNQLHLSTSSLDQRWGCKYRSEHCTLNQFCFIVLLPTCGVRFWIDAMRWCLAFEVERRGIWSSTGVANNCLSLTCIPWRGELNCLLVYSTCNWWLSIFKYASLRRKNYQLNTVSRLESKMVQYFSSIYLWNGHYKQSAKIDIIFSV